MRIVKKNKFLLGMAMGMAAGAGLEMAMKARKGRSGSLPSRTMQAMGTAMDSAADALGNIASEMKG